MQAVKLEMLKEQKTRERSPNEAVEQIWELDEDVEGKEEQEPQP